MDSSQIKTKKEGKMLVSEVLTKNELKSCKRHEFVRKNLLVNESVSGEKRGSIDKTYFSVESTVA